MADSWRRQPHSVEEALVFVRDKVNPELIMMTRVMQFADMGNDLELVEKKLVAEMAPTYGTEVFQLHSRCADLKRQVDKMILSLAELYEARSQMVTVIENQLKQSASLKNMEAMLEPQIRVDEDTQLMELLGAHYRALWNGTELDMEEPVEVEQKRPLTPLTLIGSLDVTPTKVETPTPEVAFKPVSGTQERVDAVQVSQKQFDDIPTLVKRRAKLEQVNELYKFLFNKAVDRKRCLPMKFKEISQAGIQVFGQTGKAEAVHIDRTPRVVQAGRAEVPENRGN
ncbi:uncharacterized protein BcabD6B2_04910 [Babesia caballi]|uniref:Protein FAM33A n=1 Tax=Babesia caballi TaxID=5871 RepID=A0AAV4LMJ9_BABCB|nr:hypothetical protein BcabD6B2_04910 [Babesia caballi]